ncbi:hypothetical protein [Nonomuraea zeae]|uniref:hypothetical protein n=1 Tax=Nonomuraea zeae TaxID=1642303 RepID=UPI001479382B|nr:hypothetical protein [Nonomuraea zeae]
MITIYGWSTNPYLIKNGVEDEQGFTALIAGNIGNVQQGADDVRVNSWSSA